ncbi:hypothetical protein [Aeromicrobium wangtongii]|uniref:Uncharacterized protein n=1 Tax=Aeromicrobium wangtongii TaxID=2969247 RepID=A0ABY5M5B0_9ACTN|nr:hypothetical protein [Aeromicrobium wangtongii]MCD9198314.1 hypothetical protein [Aeromicrobium wangtongii]UUP12346.1 hypothetical protein NQV15_10815 [Aeromicrobium wangtongii]
MHADPARGTQTEGLFADAHTDADNDGLSARAERLGFTTASGATYVTDPDVADSDRDGLTDGEEAGARISKSDTSLRYHGISDPREKDTDEDGVTDSDEYFLGTDPWSDDTDDDGLQDDEELEFASDPVVDNPDADIYSDEEEMERGSAPMTYDKSGWRAKLGAGLTLLKVAVSTADKHAAGGRLRQVTTAVKVAKAAGVAAPLIWDVLRKRDMSGVDTDKLHDAVFGNDMDELGAVLEGGRSSYVAFVGRSSAGSLVYVGITNNFNELSANHGGSITLEVVGGRGTLPLGQARAVAEAVIGGAHDRMSHNDLKNSRHVIDPANNLYTPARRWGSQQLKRTGFEW